MKNKACIFLLLFIFCSCSKDEQHHKFSQQEMNELLRLSDTSNMMSETEVEYKLSNITQIFQRHNDLRGLFPLIYQQTTHQALLSLQNEPHLYTNIGKAKEITLAFAKRYLFNLRDHLTGKTPEYHWKQYYELCLSTQPKTRSMCAGLNAHLTVDLARSVYDVSGDTSFKKDYIQFGEALVKATPFIIEELKKQYNIESSYLFHGLFIGDILDPIFGENFTTQLAFTFIRQEAFQNGQYLLSIPAHSHAQQALFNSWKFREELLDGLAKNQLLE